MLQQPLTCNSSFMLPTCFPHSPPRSPTHVLTRSVQMARFLYMHVLTRSVQMAPTNEAVIKPANICSGYPPGKQFDEEHEVISLSGPSKGHTTRTLRNRFAVSDGHAVVRWAAVSDRHAVVRWVCCYYLSKGHSSD